MDALQEADDAAYGDEIDDVCRLLFDDMFGVPVQEQKEMERWVSTAPFQDIFNHASFHGRIDQSMYDFSLHHVQYL